MTALYLDSSKPWFTAAWRAVLDQSANWQPPPGKAAAPFAGEVGFDSY